MRTLPDMKTLLKLGAAIGAATGTYALLVRPRLLRWGARADEVASPGRGAELIPDGKRVSTMATTIDAPPSAVWPWLVQMGYDRAGWYSWDPLDHFGIPSARRLHSEWQSLSLGQRLAATPDGKFWFEVAALEPERVLGLRVFTSHGHERSPGGPRPRVFTDSIWEFALEPLAGGRTRLVVRVHAASRGLWNRLVGLAFWEPAHFIMQTRQFTNLKRRIAGERAGWAFVPAPELPGAPQPRI